MSTVSAPRAGRLVTAATLLLLSTVFGVACGQRPDDAKCASGITCPPGMKCVARQATCILDDCGDGVLQPGELCDDGNVNDGDGCSADCKSYETCGNRIVDTAVGEACDDGNDVSGDGCSADCRSNETCGNGIVDTITGEVCDDGDAVDGGGCSSDCKRIEACGNGVLEPGEECETGANGAETATCNVNCTLSRHGDGIVNPLAGEQCDGGSGNPGDTCQSATCNANCTLSKHGDGIVNPLAGEECDGGTGTSANCESPTCNANCTWSRCGDSIVNAMAGEQCDDGNNVDNDACLNTCRQNVCGDGVVNLVGGATPKETCDLGARIGSELDLRNGDTACPYGMTSCTGCRADCSATTTPAARYCGNGTIDSSFGEECDNLTKFACGTCSLGCRVATITGAKGTITVLSTAVDGDSLTINDGSRTFTLAFDTGNGCQPTPDNCIAIGATTTALATSIMNAINGWTSPLSASILAATPSQVDLVNTVAGIDNNIPITTAGTSVSIAPAVGAIVVDGMAGGVGCLPGDRCVSNSDCVTSNCNSNTKVCQ